VVALLALGATLAGLYRHEAPWGKRLTNNPVAAPLSARNLLWVNCEKIMMVVMKNNAMHYW
jgi:hypothetical protein